MLDFLQCEKKTLIFPIDSGKNQLNFVYVHIKMHPTTDHDMGNKPMLVQNFHEQHLVPWSPWIHP